MFDHFVESFLFSNLFFCIAFSFNYTLHVKLHIFFPTFFNHYAQMILLEMFNRNLYRAQRTVHIYRVLVVGLG